MANVDIIKLSQQNKSKYDELIKYISEYWEYLTYEELSKDFLNLSAWLESSPNARITAFL
jgi:long-subunit acyl-CoA synthetase (AMP-forming)